MQNWKIWTTNTFRGYRDYPLNVFFSFYIRSHYLCKTFYHMTCIYTWVRQIHYINKSVNQYDNKSVRQKIIDTITQSIIIHAILCLPIG